MKHPRFCLVAVFVLFVLAVHVAAGASPDGFVDIPWRATPSEAKMIMLRREGVRIKEETPERIVLTGGNYTGHPVERWELEFVYEGFQRGTVYLPVPAGTAKDGRLLADHLFDDFFRALTAKYGQSSVPGNPGVSERVWEWTVADPHTGDRTVRSILLSDQWSGPLIFKVQYANRAAEVSHPAQPSSPQASPQPSAPIKSSDL